VREDDSALQTYSRCGIGWGRAGEKGLISRPVLKENKRYPGTSTGQVPPIRPKVRFGYPAVVAFGMGSAPSCRMSEMLSP
jgi:hypothetical protein